jgi:nitrogen fixation/metabolism regulation signal transduction histidine kinase
MSLKYKYVLFIGVLHIVLIVLIYFLLQEKKWYFLLSEFLMFFSLYLSYNLYKSFIRPITLMQTGTDALSDGEFNTKYVKTGSKEIDNLVGVFNEMIERLRQERTLMTEQSYFIQNLIEVTPIGIIIMDFDGLVSNMNPASKNILGVRSNMNGQNLFALDSELIQRIKDINTSESIIISTSGIDKYKCQKSEVIHQGFKRQFIVIDDLSREMLASEKEAYGRIIRMMAHEVNNSMGAINSILDTVVEFGFQDSSADQELKESLEIAKERNLGLSAFMANYASILRLPEPNKQKLNLVHLLKSTGQLFQPIASEKDISIDFDLPNENVTIEGDKVHLQQVISNIIKNAIESIYNNGDIKISCSVSPKQFIIADNGSGIRPENEGKLFTPFFSTKPTGQGIGLMLIRDILINHNTKFSLMTDKETGWTEFKVLF